MPLLLTLPNVNTLGIGQESSKEHMFSHVLGALHILHTSCLVMQNA